MHFIVVPSYEHVSQLGIVSEHNSHYLIGELIVYIFPLFRSVEHESIQSVSIELTNFSPVHSLHLVESPTTHYLQFSIAVVTHFYVSELPH